MDLTKTKAEAKDGIGLVEGLIKIPDDIREVIPYLVDGIMWVCIKTILKTVSDKYENNGSIPDSLTYMEKAANESRDRALTKFNFIYPYENAIGFVCKDRTVGIESVGKPFPIVNVIYELDQDHGGGYNEKLNCINIYLDIGEAYNSYEAYKKLIIHTIEHELMHYVQFGKHPDFKRYINNKNIKGLPRGKLKNVTRGGVNEPWNPPLHFDEVPHGSIPLEFKPNVFTYSSYIHEFLRLNFKPEKWKEKFIYYFIKNTDINFKSDLLYMKTDSDKRMLVSCKNGLSRVRKSDFDRWKQYMKEIYKEVFK